LLVGGGVPMLASGKQIAKRRRDGNATRNALLNAAMDEFNEFGFEATNSNKIAARAGYAPQSFYNHFDDKLEIFIERYLRWAHVEFADLAEIHTAEEAAAKLIKTYASDLGFRRAVRHLALIEPRMRTARAKPHASSCYHARPSALSARSQ